MSYTRRMGVRGSSRRVPRHLRNEDLRWDDFTHKTYQVELLDSALHNNTIVCMGSSTGRMFIAIMLIKEMASSVRAPWDQGGKRSFFLVQTEEDIQQLAPMLQHALEMSVLLCYQQTVNSWTMQHWKEQLNSKQLMVMTGSLYRKLLQDQMLGLNACNLLILDECHHVLKDHPFQYIMKRYGELKEEERPRILGLTCNIFAGKYQNPDALDELISSLERALHARAETSTLVIAERYGIRPQERVIECDDYIDRTGLCEELYILLEDAIDFLESCKMELTKEMDNRDPCQIPKAALIECHNILTTLGPWCAACLADMLIVQLEKIEKQKEFLPLHKKFLKLAATKLRMLSKIFDNHFKQCDYSVEELLAYSTPKVTKLMDSLRKYRPETDFVIISEDLDQASDNSDSDMSDFESDFSDNENDDENEKSPGGKQIHVAIKKVSSEADGKSTDPLCLDEDKYLCGIVFVDNQHEAYALNKFIEEVCSWDENLCFVKSSHITAVKSMDSKEKKQYKRQEEILRKFRMQELNLLVATNVLEEGVDIPKCNCIIRFDLPRSYKSYSLSKGRARARDAEYIILVEGENVDEFQAQRKNYHTIEKVLIRREERLDGISLTEPKSDFLDTPVEPYIPSLEESQVRVTLDTAIMLINRYCAKLPSDAFTHLTPSSEIHEVEIEGQRSFTASLRLPINSPVKVMLQGPPMGSRLRAKQAVALRMCEILHKQGELDDSLMPVGKEILQGEEGEMEDVWDDDEDILGEARPGTTKRKQYYCKKVSSALLMSHPLSDQPCNLYIINMTLTGPITDEQNTRGRRIYAPEETHRSFGILTSKVIPLVPMFPVFTRSGEVTVAIDLLREGVVVSPDQLGILKTFHRFLFSNVLRLEKDPMDFSPSDASMGYLVVPLTKEEVTCAIDIDWKFTTKVESSIDQNTADPPEKFEFVKEDYEDAVVMPSYRNIDQPQYFYVAEIRTDLNPLSPFPSPELYKTFAAYYTQKYGLTITNMEQPLLDVDHTSARLNLLIPRYMNQKGVALPTSSAETKKARRENLQQKQILVPELCDIHVFCASLWRKAVCLPAILYRMNYLLLAEEIRKHVASETRIGVVDLEEGFRFPQLDFGFDTSPENLIKAAEVEMEAGEEKDAKGEISQTDSDEEQRQESVRDMANLECKSTNEKKVIEQDFGLDTQGKGNVDPEVGSHKEDLNTLSPHKAKRNVGEKLNCLTNGVRQHVSDKILNTEQKREDKETTFHDLDEETNSTGQGWDSADIQCSVCAKMCQELNMAELQLTSCPKCAELKSQFQNTDSTDGGSFSKCKAATNGFVSDEDVISGMKNMTFTIDDKTDVIKNGMSTDYTLEEAKSLFDKMEKEFSENSDNASVKYCSQKNVIGSSGTCNDSESVEPSHVQPSNVQYEEQSNNCDKKDISQTIISMTVVDSDSANSANHDCTEAVNDVTEVSDIEKEDAQAVDIFKDVGSFVTDSVSKETTTTETRNRYNPLIFLDENIDLSTFVGPSPCFILQALTMSNANDFFSLERLETIGDSFLKYAITVYLYCSYPGIHEGKLSYLRSKQVSNYNLYRLGKNKSLAECMVSTKFEPYENWLPPGYVVNEDKRKGPVPKTHIANLTSGRMAAPIFASLSSMSGNDFSPSVGSLIKIPIQTASEIYNFNIDLVEADLISQELREEEDQKTGKAEAGLALTAYNLQLHHCLPDKSIADCVEALIGCYLTSCGKMAALRFMSWMGLKVLPKKHIVDDGANECVDALFDRLPCPQSPFQNQTSDAKALLDHLLSGYDSFEEKIGYTFQDRSYLLQAFTHASYHYNTVTDCYQRLEFLGDAVLDYVITRHLYEDSDKYSPGVLTDLRSALVNNNIFAALAVKWDFHKYFKAVSPALFNVIEKFVARQKEQEDEIDVEDEEEDHDQEKEHMELEVPKALGDIFESVAGAVYLDSGMSLDVVWRVFYRIMGPQIDKYLKNIPKSPVRELLEQEPETAKFEKPERTMDGKIRVTVNIVGKGVFTGVGRNYRIAKSAAAKKALRCIKTYEAEGLYE